MTFGVCQQCVDEWVLVSEEEIARALYVTLQHEHKVVEGAAAMAIACVLQCGSRYAGKTVAVISCGNNISVESLKQIIDTYSTSQAT
jgi:threonine dehydratase